MRSRRGSGDLRKLIMSPRRRRNGRSNQEVPRQDRRASCQGGPGIVKDVPPLRECERGTDPGTEVEGSVRGSRDHRNLNAVINPFVSPR